LSQLIHIQNKSAVAADAAARKMVDPPNSSFFTAHISWTFFFFLWVCVLVVAAVTVKIAVFLCCQVEPQAIHRTTEKITTCLSI
jgi:hypothetical protein